VICQAEALDLNKTVLQTVEEAAEDWRINDIKSLLGRCNFKAEMLDRKVAFLSGGEKVQKKWMMQFLVTTAYHENLICLNIFEFCVF